MSSDEKLSNNRSSIGGFSLEGLFASTTITFSVVVDVGCVVVVVIVVFVKIGMKFGEVVVCKYIGMTSQFLPLKPEGHSQMKSPSSRVSEIHLPPF